MTKPATRTHILRSVPDDLWHEMLIACALEGRANQTSALIRDAIRLYLNTPHQETPA